MAWMMSRVDDVMFLGPFIYFRPTRVHDAAANSTLLPTPLTLTADTDTGRAYNYLTLQAWSAR